MSLLSISIQSVLIYFQIFYYYDRVYIPLTTLYLMQYAIKKPYELIKLKTKDKDKLIHQMCFTVCNAFILSIYFN